MVWLAWGVMWRAGVDRYTSVNEEHETIDILHGYAWPAGGGRLNDADPFGNWKRFLFVQKTRLMRFRWL